MLSLACGHQFASSRFGMFPAVLAEVPEHLKIMFRAVFPEKVTQTELSFEKALTMEQSYDVLPAGIVWDC